MTGISAAASSLSWLWLLCPAVIAGIGLLVLRWAVRNNQFSDPRHCARLPLESFIRETGQGDEGKNLQG